MATKFRPLARFGGLKAKIDQLRINGRNNINDAQQMRIMLALTRGEPLILNRNLKSGGRIHYAGEVIDPKDFDEHRLSLLARDGSLITKTQQDDAQEFARLKPALAATEKKAAELQTAMQEGMTAKAQAARLRAELAAAEAEVEDAEKRYTRSEVELGKILDEYEI